MELKFDCVVRCEKCGEKTAKQYTIVSVGQIFIRCDKCGHSHGAGKRIKVKEIKD